MIVSDEFIEDVRRFAVLDYGDKLMQFYRLRDQHLGDGLHPDVVKAKEFLDRAKRLRSEVEPGWEAIPQVAA